MARIRTIKPEYWQDEKLSPLPALDRLVFLGLISQADDGGRLVDSVRLIDGLLFPHTPDTCAAALETLARVGVIERGKTASGQSVIQIVNWHHQKIDKPNLRGALPPIATGCEPSPKRRRNVGDESPNHTNEYDQGSGSTINDQLPPTDDPRAAAVAEMSTDLNVEIGHMPDHQRAKVRAAARSIIDGDSRTTWLKPGGGEVVPWPQRPSIFRLALADCVSQGELTLGALQAKVRYHTQRELDPYPSKRPPPDSPARQITNEIPQSHDAPRVGRATTTGGMDPLAEQRRREREDIERADAWAKANPDAANAITADVMQEMAEDSRWKGTPDTIVKATRDGEVRRRILETLQPRRTA